MKKILLICLIMSMSLVLLVSCGKTENPKTQEFSNSNSTDESIVYTNVSEQITGSEITGENIIAQTSDITATSTVIVSTPTVSEETGTTASADLKKYHEILTKLDFEQKKFFEICQKREETSNYETDKKYFNFFTELETLVSSNNEYYERYIRIESDLGENNYGYGDDLPDGYYIGSFVIWSQIYEKYDELLNDLYAYIKSQIPEDSFKKLENSEIQWIEDRENFINGFYELTGDTPALSVRAELTKFRCLLLMLYL